MDCNMCVYRNKSLTICAAKEKSLELCSGFMCDDFEYNLDDGEKL